MAIDWREYDPIERVEGVIKARRGDVRAWHPGEERDSTWDVEIRAWRKGARLGVDPQYIVVGMERESGCPVVSAEEPTTALGRARDRAERFVRMLGARAGDDGRGGVRWVVRFADGSVQPADGVWRASPKAVQAIGIEDEATEPG